MRWGLAQPDCRDPEGGAESVSRWSLPSSLRAGGKTEAQREWSSHNQWAWAGQGLGQP